MRFTSPSNLSSTLSILAFKMSSAAANSLRTSLSFDLENGVMTIPTCSFSGKKVSVSAGTISLIEFEIGVTNGYEAIETDTYSFTVRPKTRLEGFKRPIITETVLLLQGTKLGSARYLSGADVKVNEYAL